MCEASIYAEAVRMVYTPLLYSGTGSRSNIYSNGVYTIVSSLLLIKQPERQGCPSCCTARATRWGTADWLVY